MQHENGKKWKVIGGSDTRGLVVRERSFLRSPEKGEKLQCGAIVEQLELSQNRLKYRLLKGDGPQEGWVTIFLKSEEKRLLEKLSEPAEGDRKKQQQEEEEQKRRQIQRQWQREEKDQQKELKRQEEEGKPRGEEKLLLPESVSQVAVTQLATDLKDASSMETMPSSGLPINGNAHQHVPSQEADGKACSASSSSTAGAERGPWHPVTGCYVYIDSPGESEFFEVVNDGDGLVYMEHTRFGILSGPLQQQEQSDEEPEQIWKVVSSVGPSADGGGDAEDVAFDPMQGINVTISQPGVSSEEEVVSVVRYRTGNSPSLPRVAKRAQLYVFYNMQTQPRYRYVFAPQQKEPEFPLIGLSAGWLPATAVEPLEASQVTARVKVHGNFWDPFEVQAARGGPLDPAWQATYMPVRVPTGQTFIGGRPFAAVGKGRGKSGLQPVLHGARGRPSMLHHFSKGKGAGRERWTMIAGHAAFRGGIRPSMGSKAQKSMEISVPMDLVKKDGPPKPPLLSIICVRWFNYWLDTKHSDYSILNDDYMNDLFCKKGSVHDWLRGQYEIYTIFIQKDWDLTTLEPRVRSLRTFLRGRSKVAWYLLWPTCKDNSSGTEFQAGGFVKEWVFFKFMRAMERVPIRTGWPHESHVYRQLCGKLWVPHMCLNTEYRVPPTVQLSYAAFKLDPDGHSRQVIQRLVELKRYLYGNSGVGEGAGSAHAGDVGTNGNSMMHISMHTFRGVIKLGFSWGGLDVLPFQGVSGLKIAVDKLLEGRDCQSVVCLAQEMIPDVVAEHRVLCFRDLHSGRASFVKEGVWVIGLKPDVQSIGLNGVKDFKLASAKVCRHPATLFNGDTVAVNSAETQAQTLARMWINWFQTQSPEPPQNIRVDFLVTHPAKGSANVWTCEVGECGASLCSIDTDARNIAALNTAMLDQTHPSFPTPLPKPLTKNSGFKS